MCDSKCKCNDKPESCSHVFPIWVYVAPGQKMIVNCPYCGSPREIVGPTWTIPWTVPMPYTGDILPPNVTITCNTTTITNPNWKHT